MGLFGRAIGATIENVGVVNSYFNASDYVGGLVGDAYDVEITNSYNAGSVSATGDEAYVGGLFGDADEVEITNSYNAGSVGATGDEANVGGLVGDADKVEITNSYNAGSVSATGEGANVGGLVGEADNVEIANSYNASSVSADGDEANVGGLFGDADEVEITNSYNAGSVSADGDEAYVGGLVGYSSVGGLVGYSSVITIINSYNVGSVSATGEDAVVDAVVVIYAGISLTNVFYLGTSQFAEDGVAISATAKEFGDGTVARKLNGYKDEDLEVDGSVWGQSEYGEGKYPDLSGITTLKFVITYLDEKGETIKTQDVLYGKIPAFGEGAPTKKSTAQYNYELVWSPKIVAVAGNAEYKVTFKEVPRTYAVTLNVNGGKVSSSLESYTYGTGATLPSATRKGYTFEGWFTDAKFSGKKQTAIAKDATGDMEFYAKWKKDASSSSSSEDDDDESDVTPSSFGPGTAIVATVAGRNVQIAGARVGSAYAVIDMQGRLMQRGTVDNANFSVALPRTGSFLVRIDGYVQRVNIR